MSRIGVTLSVTICVALVSFAYIEARNAPRIPKNMPGMPNPSNIPGLPSGGSGSSSNSSTGASRIPGMNMPGGGNIPVEQMAQMAAMATGMSVPLAVARTAAGAMAGSN